MIKIKKKKKKKLFALIPLPLLSEKLLPVAEMSPLTSFQTSTTLTRALFPIFFIKSQTHTHTAACDQRESANPCMQICLKVEGKSQQQKEREENPERVSLFH